AYKAIPLLKDRLEDLRDLVNRFELPKNGEGSLLEGSIFNMAVTPSKDGDKHFEVFLTIHPNDDFSSAALNELQGVELTLENEMGERYVKDLELKKDAKGQPFL